MMTAGNEMADDGNKDNNDGRNKDDNDGNYDGSNNEPNCNPIFLYSRPSSVFLVSGWHTGGTKLFS